MATHSSILAWRIPWTEEPGGLAHVVAKSQTHLATNAHFHLGCFHFLFDFFLAAPLGMRDLSAPTRDQTCAPEVEARSPNQSNSREFLFFFFFTVVSFLIGSLCWQNQEVYIYIYIFFFLNKFKYFWPCWVFTVVWAFSSYGKWGLLCNGDPQASACCGFLLWSTGPRACKLQQLWRMGSVARCHVESFHTRDRTPYSLHWQADSVLNHWPTREVPRKYVYIRCL